MRIKRLLDDVMEIDLGRVRLGSERVICLTSDRHHDSMFSLSELELKHLEIAKKQSAIILDFGDIFDAMQTKGDPRANYALLKDKYRCAAYLDELVNGAIERYKPYADNFAMIAMGNHESTILDKLGTNLSARLAQGLGEHVQAMPYAGWVTIKARTPNHLLHKVNIYYNHGSSNGGLMSFGTLDVRRMASYLQDADIIVQGHTHDCYVLPLARERLCDGKVERSVGWHVRTPSYLDDFASRGWTARTGKPPRVHGCIWLMLQFERDRTGIRFTIDVE